MSQGYLFVRGAHNSLEFDTPTEAATRTVEYMRQDGKKVESETISESQLGALNAVHLVVIYTCPGSSDRYIYSSINALSPTKGFVYTLELYSVANRYKSDRPVLDRFIKSWQMLPSSRHQPQR